MIVYIIMLFFSLLFAYLYNCKKDKKIKYLYAILATFPFLIISSIRYDVGTDYLFRYVPEFNKILEGKLVWNYEPSFYLLNRILIFLNMDVNSLFVVTSFIILLPIFYRIFKSSKDSFISIFIFFVCGYFFQSLNILREYISIALIFLSYPYIVEKKYFKWFILELIAITFHYSAIVGILLPFLNIKKIIKPNLIFLIFLISYFCKNIIKKIIYFLLSFTKFSVYINGMFDVGEIKETLLFLNLLIYLFLLFLYKFKINNKVDSEECFLLNCQALSLICILLGNVTYLFFRISFYFTIFQLLSIPKFINASSYTKKNIVIAIVFSLLIMLLIYTNVINNNEGVIPYKTIF